MSKSILYRRRAAALGYPFLVRLSLAAMAMQGAGAVAGAIEGSITFPSQLVPSMTVYAAELGAAVTIDDWYFVKPDHAMIDPCAES